MGKSFLQKVQCTACFGTWGTSSGRLSAVVVTDEKEAGNVPFRANSAPLLMPHRTPLLITTSSGPSFTKPAGGLVGGPEGPAGLAVPGAVDGPPGDVLDRVILLAIPICSFNL